MSNVATAAAILAVANEVVSLGMKLQQVSNLITKAQLEGRDITEDELKGVVDAMNKSVDRAVEALSQ